MPRPARVLKRLHRFFSIRFNRRISLFLFTTYVFFSLYLKYSSSYDCGRHVRLAFSIQASASSVDRVPRLLEALWDRCNVYAVHFDANMPVTARTAVSTFLTDRYPDNVRIVPSRHVTYAGVSMLLATLDCISSLLRNENDNEEWDFFINLSANDYPLLSPREVRRVLSNRLLRNTNFFQPQVASNDGHWFFARRFEAVHFDPSLWHITKSLHRSAPGVTHPFAREALLPALRKAEGWVILSRAFTEHSVLSADARTLLALFANTRASDEHFFPTLQAMNTNKEFPAVWDAMRHIAWSNGTHLLGRPAWLDGALAPVLKASLFESGALFARKFHGDTDLLNEIDCSLSNLDATCNAHSNINKQRRTMRQRHLERVERRIGCIIESRERGGERAVIEDCLNG